MGDYTKMLGGKMNKSKINAQLISAFNANIVNSYNKQKNEVVIEFDALLLEEMMNEFGE